MIHIELILYTTGCPKCVVLKKKLDDKGMTYATVESVKDMLAMGIAQAPMLSVDGHLMDFVEANTWINEH